LAFAPGHDLLPAETTIAAHDDPGPAQLYAQRNLIERCFGKLKIYRRIVTGFDRNDSHFLGFLYLACSLFWIN
jgi:transposase